MTRHQLAAVAFGLGSLVTPLAMALAGTLLHRRSVFD